MQGLTVLFLQLLSLEVFPNKKLKTKKPVMLRSNSGLTELSGPTVTHFLKEKLGGVEKKRKNAWFKFLCELGGAKICN